MTDAGRSLYDKQSQTLRLIGNRKSTIGNHFHGLD